MTTEEVLALVAAERATQVSLGYDAAHDDRNTFEQWINLIRHLLTHKNAGRERFVQLAAVAVAVIEWMDRKAIQKLYDRWQATADAQGETLYVLERRDSARLAEGPCLQYGVVASQASPWEKNNATVVIEPTAKS